MIDTVRKAKVQRADSDEYEWDKHLVTESQSKKIAEEQSDKVLLEMTQLFESVKSFGTKNGFGCMRKPGEQMMIKMDA